VGILAVFSQVALLSDLLKNTEIAVARGSQRKLGPRGLVVTLIYFCVRCAFFTALTQNGSASVCFSKTHIMGRVDCRVGVRAE